MQSTPHIPPKWSTEELNALGYVSVRFGKNWKVISHIMRYLFRTLRDVESCRKRYHEKFATFSMASHAKLVPDSSNMYVSYFFFNRLY